MAEPSQATPKVNGDPLTQLAPGIKYYEHPGEVRIQTRPFLFTADSISAIEHMTLQAEERFKALSAVGANQLDVDVAATRSAAWKSALRDARQSFEYFSSPEGRERLQEFQQGRGPTTLAAGCSSAANARPTSPAQGAKADAWTDCGNQGIAIRAYAKATARAGTSYPPAVTDSGYDYAEAHQHAYGTYACRSTAYANAKDNLGIIWASDSDGNSSCV